MSAKRAEATQLEGADRGSHLQSWISTDGALVKTLLVGVRDSHAFIQSAQIIGVTKVCCWPLIGSCGTRNAELTSTLSAQRLRQVRVPQPAVCRPCPVRGQLGCDHWRAPGHNLFRTTSALVFCPSAMPSSALLHLQCSRRAPNYDGEDYIAFCPSPATHPKALLPAPCRMTLQSVYSPPAHVAKGALVSSMDQYKEMYERSLKDPDVRPAGPSRGPPPPPAVLTVTNALGLPPLLGTFCRPSGVRWPRISTGRRSGTAP